MESSSNYTPLQLDLIKKPKILTDKDLEVEITKVCEILRDTCMYYIYIDVFF